MKLQNLKLGSRLGLGFAVLLLLVLIMAVIGIWRLGDIAVLTDHIVRVDAQHERILRQWFAETKSNAVRAVVVSRTNDAEMEKLLKPEIEATTKKISELQKQVENMLESSEAKALFADIGERRKAYITARNAAGASRKGGDHEEAIKIVDSQMIPAVNAYVASMQKLIDFKMQVAEDSGREAATRAASGRSVLIGCMLAALLLGGLLAWLLTRSITRPLGQAMEVADAIAMGDLSKKIDASAKDETGALLASMSKMQEVLKGFVSAQGEMKQQHDAGTISYRMDDKQFSGSYAEMAQKTNELVASHIAVQTRVMEVVSQYAKGDLSVDMDKLPGEKAQITTAIDGVKTNLQAVNAQIQVLVDAAGRGDFTVRGDEAKFEYEFRKMVAGLNSLMQTSDTGLNEVARVLGALAKGDLTEKVSNDYQGTFGKLMDDSNKTVENLTEIINQIKEASETINTASGEITQGNTDLSQRTEEQASSLEETASSMEELTSTVKQNAENAKQANQLAVSASDVAVKGGDVVKQVVTTMTGISESSKKIADIIGTIDGIAFQTNILALNAAVEAARAGEQGRGFAVVATEVRNLAQRSAAAAKEIKALIEDSVGRVDVGSKLVDEAGQTMEEIVNSVKRVTDIMAEITAASQEQSTGIEQVNQAITQMDEVTQQNAALVEEAAAAAESMQEQAGNLVQSVSQFKMVQGAGPARVAERRGTQRAANVARLPGKATAKAAQPTRKPAANTPALKKAVGAEDDWQEF